MKTRLRRNWPIILLIAATALSAACRLYNLEKKLTPPMAEFLSQVRYIITSEERASFLELPDAEKPAFIEKFWARRNPDPSSNENEFKTEYYDRIHKADAAFIGEGVAGWLTDRGSIYILYGPPTRRDTSPALSGNLGRCSEVWYYGDFPVVFVDQSCLGSFRLATFDLSPLRDLSLAAAGASGRTFSGMPRPMGESGPSFDFQTTLTFVERSAKRITATLRLTEPFERIWLKSVGPRMKTGFDVAWEVRDKGKTLIGQGHAAFSVDIAEDELAAQAGKSYVMDVPIVLDDETKIALLAAGPAQLKLTVANATGKETQKKTLEFK